MNGWGESERNANQAGQQEMEWRVSLNLLAAISSLSFVNVVQDMCSVFGFPVVRPVLASS